MKTKIIQSIRENIINIGILIAIISFLVALLLLLGMYFHAEEEYSASIMLKDIPKGAVYSPDFNKQALYWKNWINNTLQPVSVPSVDFFKIEKMDNINFTVIGGYDSSGRLVSTVLFRGIKYSDLPFVYDYKKEIDLERGNPNKWIYDFNKFSVNETAPWILTAEYKKESMLSALIINFVAAAMIGCLSGAIITYVLLLIVIVLSYDCKQSRQK